MNKATSFLRSDAHRYTHLAVGRNKPVRALAQDRFPAFRGSKTPETPTLAIAGRAYSGLRHVLNRLVYKDERSGVGMQKYRSSGTGRRRAGTIARLKK